ncbi:MAG: NUDIX hydrolase [Candidatus Diapherotrites archaeon]|nr:NUDIX hydrolase [Candidatus Diapherotrites archaeon]
MVKSKESAAALVVRNNQFLLVKAIVGRPKGLWNNPDGPVNEGESLSDCARRETFEKTGLVVNAGRLIGTYRLQDGDTLAVKYVFEAIIESGTLHVPPSEIAEAKWFSLDEIKNEALFTDGAVKSARDFFAKKFNQSYECSRVP